MVPGFFSSSHLKGKEGAGGGGVGGRETIPECHMYKDQSVLEVRLTSNYIKRSTTEKENKKKTEATWCKKIKLSSNYDVSLSLFEGKASYVD